MLESDEEEGEGLGGGARWVTHLVLPSKISGARYHLVATYSVMTTCSSSMSCVIERANPKSATIYKRPSLVNYKGLNCF